MIWPSGQTTHFFSLEEAGVQVQIQVFFFLSSFFYSLAFYCLFSQLTLLASRDFCENLFLVYELDLFKLNTLCNRDVNTTENLY